MNFNLDKKEFERTLSQIQQARRDGRPDDCSTKTNDTDIITGEHFITAALILLFIKKRLPSKIFLRNMRSFLNSLKCSIEQSRSIFFENKYKNEIKYLDSLTRAYDGLLERGVKPIPFNKPLTQNQKERFYSKNINGLAEELVAEQRKHFSNCAKMVFNCLSFVAFNNKSVPIKIKVFYFENDHDFPYTAYCNIDFKKVPDNIEWYACSAKKSIQDSVTTLLKIIVSIFSLVDQDDDCFFYHEWI